MAVVEAAVVEAAWVAHVLAWVAEAVEAWPRIACGGRTQHASSNLPHLGVCPPVCTSRDRRSPCHGRLSSHPMPSVRAPHGLSRTIGGNLLLCLSTVKNKNMQCAMHIIELRALIQKLSAHQVYLTGCRIPAAAVLFRPPSCLQRN